VPSDVCAKALIERAIRGDLVADEGWGADCCEDDAVLAEAFPCPCEWPGCPLPCPWPFPLPCPRPEEAAAPCGPWAPA
jgi:hypothetical protein